MTPARPKDTPAASPFGLRKLLPSVCILLAVLLGLARLPVLERLPAPPALSFVAIYYWSLVRPARVSVVLLFVLGLVVDAVGLLPLGTHALLFLLFHWLTRWVSTYLTPLSLLRMWSAFALWFAVAAAGECLATEWALPVGPTAADLAIYWLVSVLAYPLLHLLFDRVLRASRHWP